MTSNDPRRQHLPADPAHTPNGNHALIGKAVAEALAEMLPQILYDAFTQALSQVQVTVKQLHCATCFVARVGWFAQHAAEVEAARAAMTAAAAELAPGDPRAGMLNPLMFLPEHLQPSQDPANPNPQAMPGLAEGAVMAGGTLYCAEHVPGAPVQAGRKQFLIAHQPLTSALLAEVMQAGQAA